MGRLKAVGELVSRSCTRYQPVKAIREGDLGGAYSMRRLVKRRSACNTGRKHASFGEGKGVRAGGGVVRIKEIPEE